MIPKVTREKWFKIMRNKKVVALFAGHYHRNVCTWPYPKAHSGAVATNATTEKASEDPDATDSDEDLDEYKVDEKDVINPLNVSFMVSSKSNRRYICVYALHEFGAFVNTL